MVTGSVADEGRTVGARIPAEMRLATRTTDVVVREGDMDSTLSPMKTLASFNSHVIGRCHSAEYRDLSTYAVNCRPLTLMTDQQPAFDWVRATHRPLDVNPLARE